MTVALDRLETKGHFHRLRSAELVGLPRLLGARLENLNLLLLGSCQVEHLTLSALRSGHKTSHFLYYSTAHCELPSGDFREYDAAIVGLTLRALLYEAAGHAPDVAHARESWTADFAQEVLERFENNLNDRVGRIRENVPGVPLFFLSFIEPSFSYVGSLIHDTTPRNLTVFMRRANDALQRVLSVHNGCHYLDLNGAMNMVGRAHLFEDSINAFSPLLPDSAVFIDDNPREIDEVQARFPGLRCLGGNHRDWRRIILQAPEMQVAEITQESSHRTQMVKASINRKAVAHTMSREEWLRSLELRQDVVVITNEQDPLFSRTLELLNKTNQFNTTGERWSQEALIAFLRNGGVILATSLRDKAVNNGVVGVCLVSRNEIVQAVLSCRVFGLGAEIVLGSIATALALQSASVVVGRTIDTGRNAASRDFFTRLGYTGDEGSYQAAAACSLPDWIEVSGPPLHPSREAVEDS